MRQTVLIVDDHQAFRESARLLLEANGFDVIAEATDGEEALEQVGRAQPQVVLLDVQLLGADGFAVAERLARLPSPPSIILMSSRESVARDPRLASTAARGFVPKAQLSGSALAALLRRSAGTRSPRERGDGRPATRRSRA